MNTVRINRVKHPLHGRQLQVLGRMCRHGRVELLLVLPDGSKSLVPASWTDLDDPDVGDPDVDAADSDIAGTLGSVTDLLALRDLVDGLAVASTGASAAAVATGVDGRQAARQSSCEEDNRAACTAESATRPGSTATGHADRRASRASGRRGGGSAGGADRQDRQPTATVHGGRRGGRL